MPYSIRKRPRGWVIISADTGKVVGHSKTKKAAQASIRARLAGDHGKKRK